MYMYRVYAADAATQLVLHAAAGLRLKINCLKALTSVTTPPRAPSHVRSLQNIHVFVSDRKAIYTEKQSNSLHRLQASPEI